MLMPSHDIPRVAIAACCDVCTCRAQRLVDEQRIVHIATRRADVYHDLRVANVGDARHTLLESLIGSHTTLRVVELPLFGESNSTLDVDYCAVDLVFDLDLWIHLFKD